MPQTPSAIERFERDHATLNWLLEDLLDGRALETPYKVWAQEQPENRRSELSAADVVSWIRGADRVDEILRGLDIRSEQGPAVLADYADLTGRVEEALFGPDAQQVMATLDRAECLLAAEVPTPDPDAVPTPALLNLLAAVARTWRAQDARAGELAEALQAARRRLALAEAEVRQRVRSDGGTVSADDLAESDDIMAVLDDPDTSELLGRVETLRADCEPPDDLGRQLDEFREHADVYGRLLEWARTLLHHRGTNG